LLPSGAWDDGCQIDCRNQQAQSMDTSSVLKFGSYFCPEASTSENFWKYLENHFT